MSAIIEENKDYLSNLTNQLERFLNIDSEWVTPEAKLASLYKAVNERVIGLKDELTKLEIFSAVISDLLENKKEVQNTDLVMIMELVDEIEIDPEEQINLAFDAKAYEEKNSILLPNGIEIEADIKRIAILERLIKKGNGLLVPASELFEIVIPANIINIETKRHKSRKYSSTLILERFLSRIVDKDISEINLQNLQKYNYEIEKVEVEGRIYYYFGSTAIS